MLTVEVVQKAFFRSLRRLAALLRRRLLRFSPTVREFALHDVVFSVAIGFVVLEHQVRNRHQFSRRGDHGNVVLLAFAKAPEELAQRAGMVRCRLNRLNQHGHWTEEVKAVAFSSDGKRLMAWSTDEVVKVWDVAAATPLAE